MDGDRQVLERPWVWLGFPSWTPCLIWWHELKSSFPQHTNPRVKHLSESLAQVPGPWDGSLCSISTAGTPRTVYPGHRGESGRSCTGSPCWPPPAAHRYRPHHCGNNGEQLVGATQHQERPPGTHRAKQSQSATPRCPLKWHRGSFTSLGLTDPPSWDILWLYDMVTVTIFSTCAW